MEPIIAPSILSADFNNLGADISMLNYSDCDWIHVDVMDGVFVPNISIGIPTIKAIKNLAIKPLDIHLMIVNPDQYIKTFKDAGAAYLSVHIEACTHLHRTIQLIKAEGLKAGVAINPHTSVNLLEDIIEELDLICVMSVNPGFGGQTFIENTYKKIARLKALINQHNSKALIEVDGGVNLENAEKLVKAGADVLVAGHAVFSSNDPSQTIFLLKNCID